MAACCGRHARGVGRGVGAARPKRYFSQMMGATSGPVWFALLLTLANGFSMRIPTSPAAVCSPTCRRPTSSSRRSTCPSGSSPPRWLMCGRCRPSSRECCWRRTSSPAAWNGSFRTRSGADRPVPQRRRPGLSAVATTGNLMRFMESAYDGFVEKRSEARRAVLVYGTLIVAFAAGPWSARLPLTPGACTRSGCPPDSLQ